MDWWKIVDVLKAGPLFALCIASGLLLFGPVDLFGLTPELGGYRLFVVGAFLLSCALLAVGVVAGAWRWVARAGAWVQTWLNDRRLMDTRKRRLHDLTPKEKAYLRGYLSERSRTQNFDCTNGTVLELEAVGIVRRASNIAIDLDLFPYNIQPWAWDYLHEHPELVDLDPAKLGELRRDGG